MIYTQEPYMYIGLHILYTYINIILLNLHVHQGTNVVQGKRATFAGVKYTASNNAHSALWKIYSPIRLISLHQFYNKNM